jgi:hypothetical protein
METAAAAPGIFLLQRNSCPSRKRLCAGSHPLDGHSVNPAAPASRQRSGLRRLRKKVESPEGTSENSPMTPVLGKPDPIDPIPSGTAEILCSCLQPSLRDCLVRLYSPRTGVLGYFQPSLRDSRQSFFAAYSPTWQRKKAQGLKAQHIIQAFTARLKSRPDTKQSFSATSKVVP